MLIPARFFFAEVTELAWISSTMRIWPGFWMRTTIRVRFWQPFATDLTLWLHWNLPMVHLWSRGKMWLASGMSTNSLVRAHHFSVHDQKLLVSVPTRKKWLGWQGKSRLWLRPNFNAWVESTPRVKLGPATQSPTEDWSRAKTHSPAKPRLIWSFRNWRPNVASTKFWILPQW